MTHQDVDHVTRTLYDFAFGIDSRDYDLFRSVFTDRVELDYSSYHGGPARTMDADDWVAACASLFDGLQATQHSMSNPVVDLDGDRARCRMYMQAVHVLPNPDGDAEFTIGGYYDDRLVRTGDGRRSGWRIEAVQLTVWWRRGNPDIMRLARG